MNHTHNNHNLHNVDPVLLQQLKKNSRNLFWLGLALILLGSLAIIFSVISTEIVIIYFGAFLIIVGALECAKAFNMHLWRGYFLLHLLLGIFFIIGGIFMIANPVINAITLTLLYAWIFMITGIVRIVTALVQHVPHQGFMIVSGILSFVLGLLIYWQWPASGLWVIGMFVGIDVLFAGWSLIMVSSLAKRLHNRHE